MEDRIIEILQDYRDGEESLDVCKDALLNLCGVGNKEVELTNNEDEFCARELAQLGRCEVHCGKCEYIG